jgi:phosphocarrier protein FPr
MLVTAEGPDAEQALKELSELVKTGFDELGTAASEVPDRKGGDNTSTDGRPSSGYPEGPSPTSVRTLIGIPASAGIAVAPAVLSRFDALSMLSEEAYSQDMARSSLHQGAYSQEKARSGLHQEDDSQEKTRSSLHQEAYSQERARSGLHQETHSQEKEVNGPHREARSPKEEWTRLDRALTTVMEELRRLGVRVAQEAGEQTAGILEANALSLGDEDLQDSLRSHIFNGRMTAEAALIEGIGELLRSYDDLEDPYLHARKADLEGLKVQVLQTLAGGQVQSFALQGRSIIVARDLSPSDIGRLQLDRVAGICTAFGSFNAHSAILARALGIPAVVGLGSDILHLPEKTLLEVDGGSGRVRVDPPDVHPTENESVASVPLPTDDLLRPAETADGRRVAVHANISSTEEVNAALRFGAEGVGVLRTEFLFMNRPSMPTEEEQAEVYRSIGCALGNRPLVIRILDAGGDKPLPYLSLEPESNPFLGVRGLRLLLDRPELLHSQIRAILRAAGSIGASGKAETSAGILLPMVSTVEEVRGIRSVINRLRDDLVKEGYESAESITVGVMVEVPSSAVMARELAREVDFLSIGTNDLSQYIMSADRANRHVVSLCNALHPAVIRMMSEVILRGHQSGKPVGICGEIAGDNMMTPLLVGLGVDELSMSPPSIPGVKRRVAEIDAGQASVMAERVLKLESIEEIRELLDEYLEEGAC